MSRYGAVEVALSSPPDRETLVADLLIHGEQVAEVRREGESYIVQIFDRRDRSPWEMPARDLQAAVEAAIALLQDRGGP